MVVNNQQRALVVWANPDPWQLVHTVPIRRTVLLEVFTHTNWAEPSSRCVLQTTSNEAQPDFEPIPSMIDHLSLSVGELDLGQKGLVVRQ